MTTRPALGKLLPVVIGAIAIVVAVVVIARDRHQMAHAVHELGWASSGLALALGVAGVYVLVFVWRVVLRGLGAPTDLRDASSVFFVSQLGKYVPGSVWPVLAQMEFGRRRGIARRTMLAANVIMLALCMTVALVLAAVLLPLTAPDALHRFWWTFLFVPPLLVCLHPRMIPAVLNVVLRLAHREPIDEELSPRSTVIAIGWAAVGWIFIGLHLFVITHAFGSHGVNGVVTGIGAAAFAVAVGIAFIPAPAGAGVRDTVLVLTLTHSIGAASALAAALASRVLLVIADVLLAAYGVILTRRSSPADDVSDQGLPTRGSR